MQKFNGLKLFFLMRIHLLVRYCDILKQKCLRIRIPDVPLIDTDPDPAPFLFHEKGK